MATGGGVEDIERLIKELENRYEQLRKLPREEQRRKMAEEREGLLGAVRDIIGKSKIFQIPLVGPLMASATSILLKFFGFDPFTWLSFNEYEHNASFANRAHSNPSLYDAIQQAGAMLEQRNSGYLNSKENSFFKIVNSVADEQALAEDIIAFCRVLPAVATKDPTKIDPNDIKILLGDIIKRVLNSSASEKQILQHFSTPVIGNGYCCWVKYTFASKTSIEESCCSKTKSCSVKITLKYFSFPSEADFRAAMMREHI